MSEDPKLTRRTFVKAGAAAGAVIATGLPVVGCGNDVRPAPIVEAEVIDDPQSPRYGQIPVTAARYPDLDPVGGAVTLRLASLPPGDRPFRLPDVGILLVRRGGAGDAPEWVAFDSDCTHQGCPLGYSPTDQLIECPCHGSRFLAVEDPAIPDSEPGQVVHLPAKGVLNAYPVSVDSFSGDLYVDLNTAGSTKPPLPPPMNGKVVVSLEDFPALATVGGFAIGQPSGVADTLMLIRSDASTVVVLSALCTHRACTVDFVAANRDLECPCHGSTFDLSGAVTGSPATKPLKSYPTTFDGTLITITVA